MTMDQARERARDGAGRVRSLRRALPKPTGDSCRAPRGVPNIVASVHRGKTTRQRLDLTLRAFWAVGAQRTGLPCESRRQQRSCSDAQSLGVPSLSVDTLAKTGTSTPAPR